MSSSVVSQFALGFRFIPLGFHYFFSHKDLRRLSVIPFVIDLVVLVAVVFWGGSLVGGWAGGMMAYFGLAPTGFFLSALYYSLYLLFGLGFFSLALLAVYAISQVVAAPFNALLAEKTLTHQGVLSVTPFQLAPWLATTVRMLLVTLVKGALFVILGVIIFGLSFVPVLNLVAAFVAALMVAFDSMDYAFEAKRMGFRSRLSLFFRNFPLFSGMGASLALTLLVPGLSVLLLPIIVIGASATLKETL